MEELNFEKLLPSEPTEKEKKIIAKEFLTADAVVYRAGVYINPLSGIGEKMCKCTCSACGETFLLDRVETDGCHRYSRSNFGCLVGREAIYSGSAAICPECGKKVDFIHVSDFGAYPNYYINNEKILTLRIVKNCLALIFWLCSRSVNKDGIAFNEYTPYEAYVFEKKKCTRLVGYEKRGMYYYRVIPLGYWEKRSRSEDCIGKGFSSAVVPDKKILNGTPFENCRLNKYLNDAKDDAFPVTYMKLWQKHKTVEGLIDTGASILMSSFFERNASPASYSYNNTDFRYSSRVTGIDFKQTKPHKMLGLSRPEYAEVIKREYDSPDLLRYQKLKPFGLTFDDAEQLGFFDRELIEISKYGVNVKTAVNYLRKLQSKEKDKETLGSYAGMLRDYYKLCDKLNISVDKDTFFPKDLKKEHDRLVKEDRRREKEKEREKDAERSKRISERAKILAALVSSNGVLMIRPAASVDELKNEGKCLHHCVATYAESVANGETDIFFVRKVSEPDKPFYTLELDEKNCIVKQNRGKGNCARTPEVRAFEEQWLEFVKQNIKKIRNRKVAANG